MEDRKNKSEVEQTIDEMVKEYKQQLEEIFAKDTFKLTFDEREKLIDGKIDKKRMRTILKKLIEKERDEKNKQIGTNPSDRGSKERTDR